MGIFARISRWAARTNRALGADEGTTEGAGAAFNPALRHVEAAERQEFPPEELASDEEVESEQ